jgi:hypothetical protein
MNFYADVGKLYSIVNKYAYAVSSPRVSLWGYPFPKICRCIMQRIVPREVDGVGKGTKFKLIGDVYLVCASLVLLTLFIIDCCKGNQFTLHLIGIIFDIPALAYCSFRLFLDSHDYLTALKFTDSKISR